MFPDTCNSLLGVDFKNWEGGELQRMISGHGLLKIFALCEFLDQQWKRDHQQAYVHLLEVRYVAPHVG